MSRTRRPAVPRKGDISAPENHRMMAAEEGRLQQREKARQAQQRNQSQMPKESEQQHRQQQRRRQGQLSSRGP